MGQLRLWIEPCEGQNQTLPLPAHWDELDEEEKRAWAEDRLRQFVNSNLKSGYLVLNKV